MESINGNIKLTNKREIIWKEIQKFSLPFSANDLQKVLRQDTVNQTTIYRFLQLLTEKQIIREISIEDGMQYYELPGENHPHFICNKCGEIICLGKLDNTDLLTLTKYLGDNEAKSLNLIFRGICYKCRRKKL
ncbi:MAG: ferric uptake regulation protein [Candidatus Cloacimonadota bacterium]|nr:MAG: ferric uptake regulation protein [Candidatus Cloacimonadota bacterium]